MAVMTMTRSQAEDSRGTDELYVFSDPICYWNSSIVPGSECFR